MTDGETTVRSEWEDLSDDELEARLLQRGAPDWVARLYRYRRDHEQFAADIDGVIQHGY